MTTTTRITVLCLGLLSAAQAKPIQLDFETPDTVATPSALRAWWFPRKDAERKSPAHACQVKRDSLAPLSGKWSAKVAFVQDGTPYPSAGIGFQFPDGASIDLRALTSLSVKLRTDRAREIRISIGSQLSDYATANDTGVNLGYSTVVKDSALDLTIPVALLSYPRWTSPEPALERDAILSLASAIQITTSCASKACDLDSGWIRIDDLILNGVDDAPAPPPAGHCDGSDGLMFSDFRTAPAKQNALGGWWYAYTDSSSSDPQAHGSSLFKDSSDTWSAKGWMPAAANHDAPAQFWLRRSNPYSGYGALETQLGLVAGTAKNLSGLHSIGFRLEIPSDFPDSAVSLLFHAKKAGASFQSGRDHQARLPTVPGTVSHWCLATDSLKQPDWVGLWKEAFTPDSLLTLSWELRLGSMDSSAIAGFTLDSVMFYGWNPTGISTRNLSSNGLRWTSHGKNLRVWRSTPGDAELAILSPTGQVLFRSLWPDRAPYLEIPSASSLRVLRVRSVGKVESLVLPALAP